MEFLKQLEDHQYLQEAAMEKLPPLPQEAVGKSAAAIAKIMEPYLKKVGIELDKPAPFKEEKKWIWSVKSSKIKKGQTAYIWFNSRPRGGRGINKDRNLSVGLGVRNEDGSDASADYKSERNNLLWVAAGTYEGLGEMYAEALK